MVNLLIHDYRKIHVCKNVDNDENPKETADVEQVLNNLSTMSFLNTSTRSNALKTFESAYNKLKGEGSFTSKLF